MSELSLHSIKERWTDNAILVREGFPEGIKAYSHIAWLIAEIERLERMNKQWGVWWGRHSCDGRPI
ncbi:Uncharacterised protein [Mycobacteroides abscessus]|nr:Uncharacterised protein [Mycobacteroides abscessus]CPW85383.1 Uncharacterised protein [Mycobacteroides abscessus]